MNTASDFIIEIPKADSYTKSELNAIRERITKSLESLGNLYGAAESAYKFDKASKVRFKGPCSIRTQFENLSYGIRVESTQLGTFWLKSMPLEDAILETGMLLVKAFEDGDWSVKYTLVCPYQNVFFETAKDEPYMVLKNFGGPTSFQTVIGLPDDAIRDIMFASFMAHTLSDSPFGKIRSVVNKWYSATAKDTENELTYDTTITIAGVKISDILVDMPSVCTKLTVNGELICVGYKPEIVVHNRRPASHEMTEIARMLEDACSDVEYAAENDKEENTEEDELLI